MKTIKKPKYTLLTAYNDSCLPGYDHSFHLVRNPVTKKKILREYPKLKFAIWQCIECGKITQGT